VSVPFEIHICCSKASSVRTYYIDKMGDDLSYAQRDVEHDVLELFDPSDSGYTYKKPIGETSKP